MTDIRKSPSGARETIASGGGAFAPIGQARWLDAASALTPDGSIRAPLTTYSPFWAELVGKVGSWQLNLPGAAPAVDGSIPNLVTAPSVVIQGQSDARTTLNALAIASQGAGAVFEFRDVVVTALSFPSGSGATIGLRGEDATFTSITAAGTLNATARFVNCTIGSASLSDNAVEMVGGRVATLLHLDTGSLKDTEISPGATLRVRTSCKLIGVTFGAGSFVDLDSNQALEMDGFSWSSMRQFATFPDTEPNITLRPYLPVLGQVSGATQVVAPNGVTVINCGQAAPILAAKSSPRVLAAFDAPSPSSVPTANIFVILNAETNGLGEVLINVKNLSTTTTNTLTTPAFVICYEPRVLA